MTQTEHQAARFKLPLVFLVMLFFAWGFLTAINDILLPHLKSLFALSYLEAGLVQFCFFGAYGIMGIPAGLIMERVGNRRGIVMGLGVMALGCFLFLPAARLISYPLFLGALFVLATGIVVLQTAANPYVALLGPASSAASRLNLSQAFNSLGHTIGPSLGAWFILREAAEMDRAAMADAVRIPYVLLGFALLALALIFLIVKLPIPQQQEEDRQLRLIEHRPLLFGVLAIFLYVGAEVSIGSYLVSYFGSERLGGLSAERAGYLVSFYWGAAMLGRFAGSALLTFVRPSRLLAFNALCAMLLLILTMNSSGNLAIWSVLAIGLFNSIMFPNIFTLSIAGLGNGTSRASGFLVMAIVGGAFLPMLQGLLADSTSLSFSFVVPLCGYAYVCFYGLKGYRPTQPVRA